MLVEPPVTEILKKVDDRYSLIIMTSKRARQIIGGDEPLVAVKHGQKALSIAIDELNSAELKILTDEE